MTENVGRIYVAMQPNERFDELVDIASRLASIFGAELSGRYILDADLINLAALPFTRRISAESGEISQLDPEIMDRALDLQTKTAERTIVRYAKEHGLAWSFQTVSESGADAVLRLCTEGGFVVGRMERSTRIEPFAARLASFAKVQTASAPVLLLRSDAGLKGPILTHTGERAVRLAELLASSLDAELVAIAKSESDREKIAQRSAASGRSVRIELAPPATENAVLSAVKPGLLILSWSQVGTYAKLVRELDANILITAPE